MIEIYLIHNRNIREIVCGNFSLLLFLQCLYIHSVSAASQKQQFTHTSWLKKERKSDVRIYQSVIVKLSSTFFLHLTCVFEEV